MKNIFKSFLTLIFVFVVIAAIFGTVENSANKQQEIDISKLVGEINSSQVKELTVQGDRVGVLLVDGKEEFLLKESNDSVGELLKNYGVDPAKYSVIPTKIKGESGWSMAMGTLLPIVLPILLIGGLIYFMTRQIQGANKNAMMFGQTRAKDKKTGDGKDKVTFKDVAGVKEAKEELKEIVEFLTSPKKFIALGAKIPKGVLLMGAPGTGKTLLAKAVAGEANVPFFSISGSEFVEMFVGVGASRVRSLFQKAQKAAPCIVFIDEIDAVGRQRGAGLGGSHDEREQTLNQILVEMDGFDPNGGVIVMAATNRPDVLDPALLRPGRFDRRVVLDVPDMDDREEILKVHSQKKPLASDANLRTVAERTPGFSGADLANVLNEAAILAARNNKKKISKEELMESIEKVMMGPERKSHILSDEEKKITAYHEAGHALVANELPHADPVHKISIISRGYAAGYTLKLPLKDKKLHNRSDFIDELAVFLGGYVAEKEIFGEVTTGAGNDLQRATSLARELITQYGMSEELGPRTFGQKEGMVFLGKEIHERRDYSEKIAEKIDQEIFELINKAAYTAQAIVKNKREKLDKIVEVLLKKETIEKEEFDKLMVEK